MQCTKLATLVIFINLFLKYIYFCCFCQVNTALLSYEKVIYCSELGLKSICLVSPSIETPIETMISLTLFSITMALSPHLFSCRRCTNIHTIVMKMSDRPVDSRACETQSLELREQNTPNLYGKENLVTSQSVAQTKYTRGSAFLSTEDFNVFSDKAP